MPELDAELLERVVRWCAEAGRTTTPAELRRALGDLGWEELLAVRALLADPPPARPLGPFALADLARGAPADAAAEREREGRYPSLAAGDDAPAPSAPATAPDRRKTSSARRAARSPGIVIRRARDAAPPPPPPAPALPLLDELLRPEGRGVLERLLRRLGARRPALVAALAAGWRTAGGSPPSETDLARLLDHHGLARAFSRRERDELLHALRTAGGLRAAAAARLGIAPEALDEALARTGAAAEAERIREARRAELRGRATLAGRVRLLLGDAARLEDLGLLAEVEDDLRRRLPEHVRAVGAGGGPLLPALGRSLSISPAEAKALAERIGLALDAPRPGRPPAPPRRGASPRPAGRAQAAGGRAGAARPADRPRTRGPRAGREGPRPPRPGAPRSPRPGPPRSPRPGPPRSPRPGPPRSPRPGPPRSPRPGPPRSPRPRRGR